MSNTFLEQAKEITLDGILKSISAIPFDELAAVCQRAQAEAKFVNDTVTTQIEKYNQHNVDSRFVTQANFESEVPRYFRGFRHEEKDIDISNRANYRLFVRPVEKGEKRQGNFVALYVSSHGHFGAYEAENPKQAEELLKGYLLHNMKGDKVFADQVQNERIDYMRVGKYAAAGGAVGGAIAGIMEIAHMFRIFTGTNLSYHPDTGRIAGLTALGTAIGGAIGRGLEYVRVDGFKRLKFNIKGAKEIREELNTTMEDLYNGLQDQFNIAHDNFANMLDYAGLKGEYKANPQPSA